ncbi:unnamed protein product [Adineta ricciae]|uniref:Uncharacterized protein n=1 Tax=Adineta ricciae TaxID=249248 RepID=A0A815G932_ADIRI|nr:unnamed protein product [Adineta ricciae]CAF1335444.1 unnamed protein product [Adineta ricciae]
MSRATIITSSYASSPVTVLYTGNYVRYAPTSSYITVVDQIRKPVILTQEIVDYGAPLIIQQPDYYVVDSSPIIVSDYAPRSYVRYGVSSSRCCCRSCLY